jgi:hypothetical protein
VPGLALELVFRDTGESVADWIQAKRIPESGQLRTDHRGCLSFAALPRGRYEWMVGEQSGALEVRPGTTTKLTISLP